MTHMASRYELTAEIAGEHGLSVNQEEFDEEMRLQKERARAARGELNSMGSQAADLMNFEQPFFIRRL